MCSCIARYNKLLLCAVCSVLEFNRRPTPFQEFTMKLNDHFKVARHINERGVLNLNLFRYQNNVQMREKNPEEELKEAFRVFDAEGTGVIGEQRNRERLC